MPISAFFIISIDQFLSCRSFLTLPIVVRNQNRAISVKSRSHLPIERKHLSSVLKFPLHSWNNWLWLGFRPLRMIFFRFGISRSVIISSSEQLENRTQIKETKEIPKPFSDLPSHLNFWPLRKILFLTRSLTRLTYVAIRFFSISHGANDFEEFFYLILWYEIKTKSKWISDLRFLIPSRKTLKNTNFLPVLFLCEMCLFFYISLVKFRRPFDSIKNNQKWNQVAHIWGENRNLNFSWNSDEENARCFWLLRISNVSLEASTTSTFSLLASSYAEHLGTHFARLLSYRISSELCWCSLFPLSNTLTLNALTFSWMNRKSSD